MTALLELKPLNAPVNSGLLPDSSSLDHNLRTNDLTRFSRISFCTLPGRFTLTEIRLEDFEMFFWLALALASVAVIARGFWLYRASLTWPTADGKITRLDVERKRDPGTNGGHYFCATFTYEFHDNGGHLLSGTWYKNFSTEPEARDFATRELPVGKPVVVHFNPRNPEFSDLELDSWTYTNDRPASLNI